MKISKKRTVQVMVFAIALLLVLALSIGITGAWYQAKRQASGTVIMDQGIIIDYKGFAENAPATTWGKGVNLKLFTLTDDAALPGQQIPVNSGAVSSIKANVKSVDFYARVKLDYKFYNVVGSTETEVTTLADPSALITTSENFFGTNWVKSQNNDGWFYYGTGTTLGQFTKSTDFVALFANGAKFIIEGENFVGADNGQGGGFKIDETTSINKIEVTLTLETLQGSANAKNEGWSITPPPVLENFSSNKLTNTSGHVLNPETTTLAENTTYQVVDASNAGYKFTITNSVTGQAQTMGFDVSIVNGEATITGYTGKPTELTIPDYITVNGKNYKVTSIGYRAFANYNNLKSITIGNSVTSIGEAAFNNCGILTSVTIGNGVTSLGESAFYGCYNLTSITIPDSVTSIRRNVFNACRRLTSVTIGNGATYIGSEAFSGCSSLKSITIPDSVTEILSLAFNACRGLTSVTIGNGVTRIGSDSFSGCSGLESIAVAEGNTKYKSAGNCLIEGNTLILGCKTSEIPADGSITNIGEYAFSGCDGLTSIIIPNSVTSIERYVFSGCTGLTSITIPDKVTSIGSQAFSGCSGLTSIKVAEGNTKYKSAGNCLIEGNTLILGCKTSEIPNDGSVTSIGDYAFSDCSGLTSLTIPDSVTSIGKSAFYKCSGLTSVTIGNRVESIGSSAFNGCTNLTSLAIPVSVTSIGWGAFKDCSGLTSVTIDSGLTSIPTECFSGCSELKTVVIKGAITSINNQAFDKCSALTTILINSKVSASLTGVSKVNDTLYTEQGEVFTGEPVEGTIYYKKYTRS